MSDTRRCGPHTQIVSNDHVRVAQCTCGAYHVTFTRRGLTMQLGIEDVRSLFEAMGIAVRVADAEERGRGIAADGTGSTIN